MPMKIHLEITYVNRMFCSDCVFQKLLFSSGCRYLAGEMVTCNLACRKC